MKKKVLLLGWDAADWQIIWPLIKEGKLPSLQKLITTGVHANMSTMDPPFSPMLWTSVATGKTPDKHGVLNFIEINSENQIQPVSSHSRKTRAIWNIFTNQKIRTNIVGWWPTNPVEPINGVMVSDLFHKKYPKEDQANWPLANNAVHPKEWRKAIAKCRIQPEEITEAHILPFIPEAHLVDQTNDKALQSFAKILSQNASVHAAATKLMRETEWEFMAVYYDAIDHFCHGFMKYHPPKLGPIPEHLFNRYKDVVQGAYLFQDMMLGRMMELADENTTIMVMSDHGYESGSLRILKMPKFQAAPALEHRQFGIFAAMGPEIKKNENIFGLSLFDIAPTLLHHFDLPIGKDMDGKPILEMYTQPKTIKYIDSWDEIEGDFGEHQEEPFSSLENQEQLQQLIDLGYIDALDADKEKSLTKVKCSIKHNLARVHKGKKDFDSANELLLELITEDVDTVPFYMDLLSIALKQEEYDRAENYLNKLRTLKKEFKFTTTVSEAKIAIGKGHYIQAVNLLEEAKEKKPSAAIWFELGKQYLRLERYGDAKDALLCALEIEPDNARFNQILALIYNRLDDYESAADHAFTAIELVKFFPDAHYALGEALQNLGELEMAKNAFENAARLTPKTHHRAEHSLKNVTQKLQGSSKTYSLFDQQTSLIVSGLPRSGTSLMMQMINSVNIEALVDDKRIADISNPKGYFEYEPVKRLDKDNSWLHLSKGKALKVVAPLLKFLDPQHRYKVIFMKRNLHEVIRSQQIMIGKNPETLPINILQAYKKMVLNVDTWLRKEPGVEFLYVDYNALVESPDEAINSIINFLNPSFDHSKMKACIDDKLYRNVLPN